MSVVMSFDEAVADSARFKKRHLLLGNGFSIACRPEIFTYGSLFEQADFSCAPNLPAVFRAVGTTDFEHVIRMLEDASRIVPVYSPETVTAIRMMAADAEALKAILIETVARNHPKHPGEIADEQFRACRQFLSYFLGAENNDGRVYSLNYDLLLYWALMHDESGPDEPLTLARNDGFGRDEDTEPEYVIWMGEGSARSQRVHYLHGAIHLFDAGAELQKYTWRNVGKPLLEQAREAMAGSMYPLFVAEGVSRQKLARIKHSAYLYHSYKAFTTQMKQGNDTLFIFGHSLAENDDHVLRKIATGRIPQLYVGLYGDPRSVANQKIQKAAAKLASARSAQAPMSVAFFDAVSARVWGP